MNNSVSAIGIAAMLALTGTGCTTGGEPRGGADGRLFTKIQANPDVIAALGGAPCTPSATERCKVTITKIVPDPAKPDIAYCLAVAPQVDVKFKDGPPRETHKVVVWELSLASLDGRPLSFHATNGLVFHNQTKPDHVGNGKHGDGTPGNKDADKYNVTVKRNQPLDKSSYLPVVLWGTPGKEELCAAVDPKIVNEN